MSQDPPDSECSALTHLSMSLAHKHVNLKEPYNPDNKEQVTTVIKKKKDRLYMKCPTSEAKCPEGVFEIQSPISGFNFSNNISISQVKTMRGKTNLTRPLKPLNL